MSPSSTRPTRPWRDTMGREFCPLGANNPWARCEPPEWLRARLNIDYHVAFARHYYSVPYRYLHKRVEVRATVRTVEIFSKGERIASHVRDDTPSHYTTLAEHRPESHRAYLEWTPERLIRWAESAGPFTAEMVRRIM